MTMWRLALLSVCVSVSPPADAVESNDCLILPGISVELGGSIPGQLAEVNVEIGDEVKKGDVVAALRTEVQKAFLDLARFRSQNTASVEAARTRLEHEIRQLGRAETLQKRGVVASASTEERQASHDIRWQELREAEMQLQQAKLDLARAEAELEIRYIRAPIDGVIADRFLDPGEYLRDDGKVVTVVSLDPLRVEVFLPQRDFDAVSLQGQAVIRPEIGNETYTAEVETIDAVVDAASGTFRIRLRLPNPDSSIISGVRCHAELVGGAG